MNKSFFSLLPLIALIGFALACGGGSVFNDDTKTAAETATDTTTVSGNLDFNTGLSKARFAVGDNVLEAGEVQLQNITTGVITEIGFTGSSFSADVIPGDYIIVAKDSSNRQIRKIVPAISATSTEAGNLNLDSTVISEMVEKFKLESDGKSSLSELESIAQSISDMETLYNQSDDVLSATTGFDDTTRQMSLMVMAMRGKLKRDIKNGNDIAASGYSLDDNTIADNFDEAVTDMFSDFSAVDVVVSDTLVFDSSSTISNSDFSGISVSNLVTNIGNFAGTPVINNEIAVFSTVASDFSSSASASIDAGSLTAKSTIKAYDTSDTIVRAFGKFFYVLARFNADFIEKFDVTNPSVNVYPSSYPTKDTSESSANPQDMIFRGATKAYITRYGSTKQWIVNPSATSAAAFKKGELDLSAYNDSDNIPEASQGIIVGNKLFITMHRLDRNNSFQHINQAYVAVFDTATDQEIDTGKGQNGLKGIPLLGNNPSTIQYVPSLGLIFVTCTGQFGSTFLNTPRKFNGGIVTINPNTYESKLLVDDGDNADAAVTATGTHGGLFSKSIVVSPTKGYLAIYAAFGNLSLKTFNPTTGNVGSNISALDGKDIRGLSLDSKSRVWISTSTGVSILDPSNDTFVSTDISLGLIPGDSARFTRF